MRSILNILTGKLGGSRNGRAAVYVSAFGKHPAFGDHIQEADIPLETPALRELRNVLYKGAITQLIEGGELAKIEARGAATPWGHLLLWRGREGVVVARVWQSRDTVGRALYPMVGCLQCDRVPPAALGRLAAELLTDLERRCREATDRAQVLQAIADVEAMAAAAVQQPGPEETPANPVGVLARRPELGPDKLLPVLREFSDWLDTGLLRLPLRAPSKTRADYVRVPPGADTPGDALALWYQFVTRVAGESAPVAVAVAENRPWVDVLLGPANPYQFRCLRTSDQTMPLTTGDAGAEEFDPKFVAAAREFLEREGVPAGLAPNRPSAPGTNPSSAPIAPADRPATT